MFILVYFNCLYTYLQNVRTFQYAAALYTGNQDVNQPSCIDISDGVRNVNDVTESKYLTLTITKEFQVKYM